MCSQFFTSKLRQFILKRFTLSLNVKNFNNCHMNKQKKDFTMTEIPDWFVVSRYVCSAVGTSMLRPRTFRPSMIRTRLLYPDIFTILYVSSLKCRVHSIPGKTPYHWKFVRFIPEFSDCVNFWSLFFQIYLNPEYGQSQPTELYQPKDWLGI